MYSFWCVVYIALLTSRNITPHQNSYIYFHIQPITYKCYTCGPKLFELVKLFMSYCLDTVLLFQGDRDPTNPIIKLVLSLCCPCLPGIFSLQLSKKSTEHRQTLPSKYVLRTNNARCAHWTTPNSSRNKLAFTAHVALTTDKQEHRMWAACVRITSVALRTYLVNTLSACTTQLPPTNILNKTITWTVGIEKTFKQTR